MQAQPAPERYSSIELLRFFAATAVVFVHTPIIGVGEFGVDVFFVISGFVMLLSTERSTDRFFLKRLIRILPTYYCFTLGLFVVALILPSLLDNTTSNPWHLLQSFLFIPFDKNGAGHFPILFLGWTLNYEMYFYALFAVSLFINVPFRASITTVLLTVIYLTTQSADALPLKAYAEEIVFEFVLGMVLYHLLVKPDIRQVIFMLLLVAASVVSQGNYDDRFFVFGIPSLLFVGTVVRALKGRELPSMVLTMGGYSYALYLIHPYIIILFQKVTKWFSMGVGYQIAAFVVSMILVNLVAYLVYNYLEIPVTTALRNRYIKPK